MSRSGFSLIELLVVIAIIGILAAVGVVGYQNYVERTKSSIAEENGDTISRAFEQDYIALANDLGGPSQIASQPGNVVERTDQCISYVRKVVANVNTQWKNVYNENEVYAVNLHDDPDAGDSHSALKPGQLGIQCANADATLDSSNFYIHRCTCIGSNDCTLHTFKDGDGSQEEADYEAHVTDTNKRWRVSTDTNINGTIKLGPHVPNWVCPRADYYP